MPVKRRAPKERQLQITSEMLAIWSELHDIIASGDHEFWERDGGRQERFYTLNTQLNNVLLGRGPHETSPTAAIICGGPPPALDDDAAWCSYTPWQRESYCSAYELAQMLDQAAEMQRRRRAS